MEATLDMLRGVRAEMDVAVGEAGNHRFPFEVKGLGACDVRRCALAERCDPVVANVDPTVGDGWSAGAVDQHSPGQ
jgi:hypothetical protein